MKDQLEKKLQEIIDAQQALENKKQEIGKWVKENRMEIRKLLPASGLYFKLVPGNKYQDKGGMYIQTKTSKVFSRPEDVPYSYYETWPIPQVSCVVLGGDMKPIDQWNEYVPIDQIGEQINPNETKEMGGVYLMHAHGSKYYKIGVAIDVKKRISQIQTGCPLPIRLITCKQVYDPYWHEKNLHANFRLKGKAMNGEWFELSDEDIRFFVDYFQNV